MDTIHGGMDGCKKEGHQRQMYSENTGQDNRWKQIIWIKDDIHYRT